MSAEITSYVRASEKLVPYNPELDAAVEEEIKASGMPGVGVVVVNGIEVASKEFLIDFSDDLPKQNVIAHNNIGGYANEYAAFARVLWYGLSDPEFGAEGLALSVFQEGRDDPLGDGSMARGRRSRPETRRQILELGANLQRPLDLALIWAPHSEYTRRCYAELTKGGIDNVIALSSYRYLAQMLVGKVDTLVAVDRSAAVRQISLARELERLTGQKIPVFFNEKGRNYNESRVGEFWEVVEDGRIASADKAVLAGRNVGSIDDFICTGRSMKNGAVDLLEKQGAASVHVAAEAVLLSGDGAENMMAMLEKGRGDVHLYTTDATPRYKEVKDPNDDKKLHPQMHIHSIAPALGALTRVLTGYGYDQDVALVRTYLQGSSPDKSLMEKSKVTGRLPLMDPCEREKMFNVQMERIQSAFAEEKRIFRVS